MKYRLPSLRVQIMLLVLLLMTIALLFIRSFFIYSFNSFQEELHTDQLKESVTNLYHDVKQVLPMEQQEAFRDSVRTILRDIEQINLTGSFFVDDMSLYSTFLFVFLILVILAIFVFSSSLILRPLRRLQAGTRELAKGNFSVRVPETRVTQINDLVLSFNQMISDLADTHRRLVQAERDTMWRELARIMAHEIKNPLTPIRLAAERLDMQYENQGSPFDRIFDDSICVIQEEVENLKQLVDRFRDFAHMPLPEYSTFDMKSLLEEIIRANCERADIELKLEGDFTSFNGDRVQWREVFVNLLENAIQIVEERATISISGSRDNGTWSMQVSDSGPGIAPEDLEQIFSPYFTRRKQGTGLGLAVVRRIVQMHNGDITAGSPPGSGALFSITVKNETAVTDGTALESLT